MSCKSEGATHHMACECREMQLAVDLAHLRSENGRLQKEVKKFADQNVSFALQIQVAEEALGHMPCVCLQFDNPGVANPPYAHLPQCSYRIAEAALAKLKEIRGAR